MPDAERLAKPAPPGSWGWFEVKRLFLFACVMAAALITAGTGAASQSSPIRIESWLMRVTDGGNALVGGNVVAAAKVWIDGKMVGTGGAPTWSEATYASTSGDLYNKATDWTAVGGYRFEGDGHLVAGNAAGHDHIVFARHEIELTNGSISIQFTGKYGPTFAGAGHWVITGGTGDYAGLQGTGAWEAQGYGTSTGLYFMHTETGAVHWR